MNFSVAEFIHFHYFILHDISCYYANSFSAEILEL